MLPSSHAFRETGLKPFRKKATSMVTLSPVATCRGGEDLGAGWLDEPLLKNSANAVVPVKHKCWRQE